VQFLSKLLYKNISPWINECSYLVKKGETGLTENIYSGHASFNIGIWSKKSILKF
jgi:hypothetical protein